MALQITRAFVVDDVDVAVEAAIAALHDTVGGLTYFATTDVDGIATFSAEEGVYALSVTRAGMISAPAVRVEVMPPPAATAATYNPPGFAAPGLVSATAKNVKIAIDGNPAVTVDVSAGDDVVTDVTELVANINAALAVVDIAWGSVAYNYLGEVRLVSPTTGATSSLEIVNDGSVAAAAADIVFGVILGSGNILLEGQDAPGDYNDFDVVITPYGSFAASNPNHCMLWARFWRHELTTPLVGAQIIIQLDDRPTSIDVGLDVGDSFYAKTDAEGYVSFELMRNSRARLYFVWLDRYVDFVVPDRSSLNLEGVLAPYVIAISVVAPEPDLVVGTTYGVSVEAQYTDGSVKSVREFSVSSSDASVVSVDGLELTAVAAGVADVVVTHVNTKNQSIVSNPLTMEVT
jgi:hypothetical protein